MTLTQQNEELKVSEAVETSTWTNKWLEGIDELVSTSYTPAYKAAAGIFCLAANADKVPYPEIIAVNKEPNWVEIEWDVKAYSYYITFKFTTDAVGNIQVELFIRPYDKENEIQNWILLSTLQFTTLNNVNLGSFTYINLTIKNLLEIGKNRTNLPF